MIFISPSECDMWGRKKGCLEFNEVLLKEG